MKEVFKNIVLTMVALVVVTSCSSPQSLQEYYVDSSDNPNFISLDVPASILNLEIESLSEDQKKAMRSLKKLNVLAFRKTADNGTEYISEKQKVNAILKNDRFTELMKLSTSYGKGVVKYLGDEDAIDEVVIYGNSDDKGFALIRILGNNMKPAHLVQLIQELQKSDFDGKGVGGLERFLKR